MLTKTANKNRVGSNGDETGQPATRCTIGAGAVIKRSAIVARQKSAILWRRKATVQNVMMNLQFRTSQPMPDGGVAGGLTGGCHGACSAVPRKRNEQDREREPNLCTRTFLRRTRTPTNLTNKQIARANLPPSTVEEPEAPERRRC